MSEEDLWKVIADMREQLARSLIRVAQTSGSDDGQTRALLHEDLTPGGSADATLQKFDNGTWKTWRAKKVKVRDPGDPPFVSKKVESGNTVWVVPRWEEWWVLQGPCGS